MTVVPGSALRSLRVAVSFLLFAPLANAQQPIAPAPADPAIAAALKQVSPDRIHATIEKLVSFNNRSTLSSMETDLKPGTGVSAAADWIESEFKRISADCGNCLEVRRDDFIEPPQTGPRLAHPQADEAHQRLCRSSAAPIPPRPTAMVLVTGHYDSRNTDNLNTHDPAPGANDDASGVAVSTRVRPRALEAQIPLHHRLRCRRRRGAGPQRQPPSCPACEVAGLAARGRAQQRHRRRRHHARRHRSRTRRSSASSPRASRPPPRPSRPAHLINLGAESDSPSRELARAVAEIVFHVLSRHSQRRSRTGTPPGRPHSNLVRTTIRPSILC